jgi:formate dehydrogenase
VVAKVEDGRIVGVRADPENPHSQGFMCTKPHAMIEILNDPDRVTQPLKRVGGPGEFVPVSWDEALDDIAARLKRIVEQHGGNAFATSSGNPAAFDAAGTLAGAGLRAAIGSERNYGVNGEDGASYVVAAALQFGSGALWPRPDLWRTDFLLMAGANPWISKGSVISEPQIRKAMKGIVERGGRVVVIDPRRTETARHFEHVALTPGTDWLLLLGMLKAILADGLEDRAFIEEHTTGSGPLERLLARVDLDDCAGRTGVPVATIEDLARGFATARSATAYVRTGVCTQRFGTLNNLLINALNTVTGNLNRPGGAMFGYGALDFPKLAKASGAHAYDTIRTPAGLPASLGLLPSQSLWRDITARDDRVRALCTHSSNPVLSSGAGGERLIEAMEQHLELHFSLDLYMNETNRHADYILPGTTMYERSDLPTLALTLDIRPTLFATDKVVEPRGEARDEWRVYNEVAKRMGLGGAYPVPALRWLSKRGIEIHPMALYDMTIRTGPFGDYFGLKRGGWSLGKLRKRAPSGVALSERLPTQDLATLLDTPDGKVQLAPPQMMLEAARALERSEDEAFPLRAIGLRELHSHNSWMHNAKRMMPSGRVPSALVHPDDAAAAGIAADGDPLRIESAVGAITIPAAITEDMSPGAVAIPHGWGHNGGWRLANSVGGVSSNVLASDDLADIERLAGMSILTGIPIRIAAVPRPEAEPVAATVVRA